MYRAGVSTFYQPSLPFFWINLVTNILAMLYLVVGIPIIVYFYGKNQHLWEIEKFEVKFGQTLESLRTDKKHSLFYPVFFIFRRIVLAWQGVSLGGVFLFQMNTLFFFSFAQIAYIIVCRPFETELMMWLEILNESTMILSLYSIFLFNALWVTDA